jgi:hypothetical protein
LVALVVQLDNRRFTRSEKHGLSGLYLLEIVLGLASQQFLVGGQGDCLYS